MLVKFQAAKLYLPILIKLNNIQLDVNKLLIDLKKTPKLKIDHKLFYCFEI